ncbi:MAG: class I SAM-dependent methyltransferase [Planctomycetota bacterium]
MTQPNLNCQLKQRMVRVHRAISRLAPTDPLRPWFFLELKHLEDSSAESPSLENANASLRALRQLELLLFEHCAKLQNDGVDVKDELEPVSYLSTRARLPANVRQIAKEKRFSIEPELLFSQNWDNDTFDPVSPTAKIVGYLRSRDPALQIADDLSMDVEGERLLASMAVLGPEAQQLMGGLFQARHHGINAALSQLRVSQILELASGISPRGLQWAKSMPNTLYVESDLPALMIHKAKLLRNHVLATETVNHGILHCCGLDVLNRDNFVSALEAIDTETPFVIVSEGLLLYFDKEELGKFLDNIATLLRQFPNSTWVTDIVTQRNLAELIASQPEVAKAVKEVFSMTGRSVIGANPFESDDCVNEMLASRQLVVQDQQHLKNIAELTLVGEPSQLDRSKFEFLGDRKIWSIKG